jgi:cellulose synthase/poly-beta-1,6-N-acetylglucosamine synthase-like glycosyltransferase
MADDQKGFFATLFDFSFTSFLTIKFLKVIYGLLMGLIALGALVFLIAGLSQGGSAALVTFIVVPAVALVYLVIVRISMEAVALFFRIGENTSALVTAAGLPQAGGPRYGQVGPGYGQTSSGYGHVAPGPQVNAPAGPTGSSQGDQER